MSQWCVESYPSSLYKFEIFSKLMFLAFWRNSGRDQGGPNPCLLLASCFLLVNDQLITITH